MLENQIVCATCFVVQIMVTFNISVFVLKNLFPSPFAKPVSRLLENIRANLSDRIE